LLFFYRGKQNGLEIPLKDSSEVLEFMQHAWKEADHSENGREELCEKVLARQEWWGRDLTKIPNLTDRVADHLNEMDRSGIVESLKSI
jgi:tagaturonate reductase